MSTAFTKNKEKRTRSASSETNSSFVKNVTSAVSGLLPATITKWFSSPSSSNANGSAPAADATDSSTEDEAPESPAVVQPPAKRMKYNTPGQHFGPNDANYSVSNTETLEPPYSPYNAKPYPIRNTLASTMHTPTEDTVKDSSERDTTTFKSQHSISGIGQSVASKRKSIFDTYNKEESKKACAKTSANTMRDPKQPCFKPSLLGSPFYPGRTMYGGAASSYINQPNIKQKKVALVNECISNDDSGISTSARRIMDLLEQYSSPLREAKRISHYTRTKNDSINTSADIQSSVRSAPYTYKTQELHVPSIASILRLKQRSRLMDTTNAARQIIASHSSTSPAEYPAYPNLTQSSRTEHQTDQGVKMTTKVKSRLTRANRGNQEQLEVATPVKLPTAVLSIDQDKLPKFNFGTPALSLQATSTPKSIFNIAEGKTSTEVFTSKPDIIPNNIFKFSKPVPVSTDMPVNETTPPKYKFDSPERRVEQKADKKDDGFSVVGNAKESEKSTKSDKWKCQECWVENNSEARTCVCCGAKQASVSDVKVNKCSKCKLIDCQPLKDKCANCEKMQSNSLGSTFGVKSSSPSEWKCSDCWAPNKPDSIKCVCCGGKPPSKSTEKSSKCSICKFVDCQPLKDRCVNCDKIQQNSEGSLLASVKSSASTKWKCDECWVNNDNTAEKCVSCGVAKPKKSSTPILTSNVKNDTADWKCDDCWISNKSSVDKCAACGSAKPGAKQAVAQLATGSPLFKPPDDTFKNISKSQKDEKWECSSCLVRNEANKSLCVCCGTERERKNKMPEKKFNFGSNTSFKFGINPNVQEATLAKKPELESQPQAKLKEQSEKNNNILSETPTFTFTSPTKKPEDKVDAAKPKTVEPTKTAFTFGIPKQSSTPAAVTSKPTEPPQTSEKEKPQEVPKVNFSLPSSQDTTNPLGGLFSSPLKPPDSSKATDAASSLASPPKAVNNKDAPSNPISIGTKPAQSNATNAVKPALGGFTFGGSAKPPTNLFGTPTTTATATSLFTAPDQTATTAPALSLFKPPETSTVSSLFQKPSSTTSPATSLFHTGTTTTAAASVVPAGPIFSFGSNSTNPTPAPAAEKPAVSFTFGSNAPKTDSSPFGSSNTFKSSFTATGDNNTTNNNAFTIPTGNTSGSTLTTTNPLTGNGVSSNSGLSGSTAELGANSLGGANGLPAYPLGGGNGLQTGNALSNPSGMFSTPVQKENVWSSSNNQSSNLFVASTTANSLQKPAAFTFGSSTPFNAGSTPAFGGNTQQPAQNIFGMNQNNNNQSNVFSSPVQSQPAPNIFGTAQPVAQSAPQIPMFGSPNVGAAPTFGSPNPSLPTFEAPAASAPAFNFGGAPQSTGIFGFGQQQQQQQQQQQPQQGVYSFGGAPAGATPQVQFSIGSGANPGGGLGAAGGASTIRRMRKAVRRNPPR